MGWNLCFFAAFAAALIVVTPSYSEAENASARLTVYVPVERVDAGTDLADIKLVSTSLDKERAAEGIIWQDWRIRRYLAASPLEAGEPIRRTQLKRKPKPKAAVFIPGDRAVHLELDYRPSITCKAGEFVDIQVVGMDHATIVFDAELISSSAGTPHCRESSTSLTLRVHQEEAELISTARELFSLMVIPAAHE